MKLRRKIIIKLVVLIVAMWLINSGIFVLKQISLGESVVYETSYTLNEEDYTVVENTKSYNLLKQWGMELFSSSFVFMFVGGMLFVVTIAYDEGIESEKKDKRNEEVKIAKALTLQLNFQVNKLKQISKGINASEDNKEAYANLIKQVDIANKKVEEYLVRQRKMRA